jgi:hypothetical protein
LSFVLLALHLVKPPPYLLNCSTHIAILGVKESGPYSIYLGELGRVINLPDFNKFPTGTDIAEIKKIVSKIITSSCIKYNKSKAEKYYGDLFGLKNDITSYKNATETIKGPFMFENIVTTNYDLVIPVCGDSYGPPSFLCCTCSNDGVVGIYDS